ncbi:MAG TPA: 2Fe-2S iron-sulfur cluster-binding protein, partial [Gammaproteobacteria bacterium]|nr:2Fe-2S iron-sulfur cluster-binding protein [Gammaproteobacteria bacterium]
MPTEATLQVSVWRGTAEGQLVEYPVPRRENQTVLDAVTYIQRHLDSTLSYRFACRVGMCGSCAMTVNGVPRWTCRTHVTRVATDGKLKLEPLRNLSVIKDLAVDMSVFFDKLAAARGAFQPPREPRGDFAVVEPDSPQRRHA